MKFKTPSKPVVKAAYYASNKHQIISQNTSESIPGRSTHLEYIIEKPCIQNDDSKSYTHTRICEVPNTPAQLMLIRNEKPGDAGPWNSLGKFEKFYSPTIV